MCQLSASGRAVADAEGSGVGEPEREGGAEADMSVRYVGRAMLQGKASCTKAISPASAVRAVLEHLVAAPR